MPQDSAVTDDRTPAPLAGEATLVAPEQLPSAVEAILLTLDKPVSAARLAEALGLAPASDPKPDSAPADEPAPAKPRRQRPVKDRGSAGGPAAVEAAVGELNRVYESTGRSFRIEAVAGGYRVMTLPAFAPVLAAFHRARASGRLSRAAVETLAIIAYKQPITRATLEAIRGVACGEVLRSLMERRLVVIKGRAEELGRPILYGTSKEFLDAFGLPSLKDLPTATELQSPP